MTIPDSDHKMTITLDFKTNHCIVDKADLEHLVQARMIEPRSDGTARVRLGRFVLFIQEPIDA
jgi:hypothetical protein